MQLQPPGSGSVAPTNPGSGASGSTSGSSSGGSSDSSSASTAAATSSSLVATTATPFQDPATPAQEKEETLAFGDYLINYLDKFAGFKLELKDKN
ncbi:hypothetical protein [Mesomycoplasma ovipneumoniae]|uniref:hypothetical protein n=1 Tax=Mesomycoplasma ovipneumoniae TaxID=29562 RepID=UPI00311ABCE3